ncbi:MAG: Ig-like domain-containing protein [Paracoccaceae bacterium]
MANKILDWSLFGSYGTGVNSGMAVDTGGIEVSVDFNAQDHGATATTDNTAQYSAAGESFDNSALKLYGAGGEGGIDNTSTTTLNFSSTNALYGDEVSDVSFRINDLDRGTSHDNHQDIVTIRAYDADGNLVPVTLTTTGGATISGNTATAQDVDNSSIDPDDSTGSIAVSIAGPVARIEIDYDNGDCTDQAIWVTDVHFETIAADARDGYVEGNDSDNLIDVAYTGDPDGDKIDNSDAILAGEAAQDDIVLAFDGNDTVIAGAGNDDVYAGGGDDYVEGGAGNDMLLGDANLAGTGTGTAPTGEVVRESFEWDQAPDPNGSGGIDDCDPITGFTQNTGNVDVTFSIVSTHESPQTQFADNDQKVHSITTDGASADAHSSLASELNSNDESATYAWDYSNPVEDLSFRINDIDNDSKVTIKAYDADGNLLSVSVGEGSRLDEIASGNVYTVQPEHSWFGSNGSDTSPEYSALINIAGPVARLEITHEQEGHDSSAINITDMYFDAPVMGPVADDCEAGNDTLDGGDGNDFIDGQGGDDLLIGGAGNDTIYGDGDATGGGAPVTTRESFEWDQAPDSNGPGAIENGDPLNSFTQNTGSVNVTYSVVGSNHTPTTTFADNEQKVHSITDDGAPVDAHSSLSSELNAQGECAVYQLAFDTDVENISFRINDIDYDSEVTIKAYDAAGNEVAINTSVGSGLTAQNLDGVGGNEFIEARVEDAHGQDTDPNFSTLVNIAGPIARLEITHNQEGSDASGINITDVYFDVTTDGEACEPGDDTIMAGDGDDVVSGDAGNDVIDGGAGADILSGGDDRDTFIGGDAGDQVDGGTGGDDYDTLDLSGQGPLRIINQTIDADGDSTSGTVQFLDGTGNVTGEMTFTEIENLILPENMGPTAGDDTATVDEDGSVDIPVLLNDTDPEGDPLTVTSATADNGTVTVNPDGTLEYTPDPDYNGPDTITYVVEDGQGGSDTGTVTVTVTPVNDAPVAEDDADTTLEDNAVVVDVLGNDSDVDGDTLTVTSATDGANGTTEVNPDGTITYTPNADFVGEDTFSYVVDDGMGGSDTATVTITVTGENDAPVVTGEDVTTDEDTPLTIDVLANDTDPDGDTLSIQGVPVAEHGTVTVNPDGTLEYTPDPDYNGPDTITYVVEDGQGGSDTGTVTVTVTPVNDAPVAEDDAETTPYNTAVTIPVLANDTDVDGDTLTVTSATSPDGTVDINPDGTLTFTPTDGFEGTATIDYLIEDGMGGSDTATVTVTVEDSPLDGIVEGTAGDDVIDVTYTGDPEGDMVDNDDALLPGEMGEDDIIEAYEGDDYVDAGLGDDEVDAGSGDDTVYGREGDDIVYGGEGNDSVRGNEGNDTLLGEEGNDSLRGGEGDDTVDGGIGDDLLYGGEGDDSVSGGEGNDEIFGNEGNDTIDGGEGDDFINARAGEAINDHETFVGVPFEGAPGNANDLDLVYGGAGNDTILTGDDADTVYGGDGDDSIDSGIDDDEVYGGAGNDYIDANLGADYVDGGDGDDTIIAGIDAFSDYVGDDPNLPSGFLIDPATGLPALSDPNTEDGKDTVIGGAGNDYIVTGDDADYIEGGADNDTIHAGIDDDYVDGGTGDDSIIGGHGSDTIYGQDGDDWINAGDSTLLWGQEDDSTDPVPENGRDFVDGGAGNDTIYGEDDDDTLLGGTGNDLIDGGLDDDSIEGGEGDDTLLGGDGNDTVLGGLGNDSIDGGRNADLLDGGEGDDTLIGGNGEDTLLGGDGNDLLDGGTGGDVMDGGDGDDTILGSSGRDTIDGGEGNDSITSGLGEDLVHGGAGDDTIEAGAENDTIYGDEGNDLLTGFNGADEIYGGDDRDTIIGGTAGDVIDGGSGGDDFDTLDLRGSAPSDGSLNITVTGPDSNGNGVDGFVTYYDAAGNETGSFDFSEIEEIIPCFTPGTTIATPKGERLVEELQIGDRVITRDNGLQEIRWIGQKGLTGVQLQRNAHLKPVLIKRGALGNGLPERDMLVSPNHRVLVNNEKTALYFEEREVLAAAKHLVGAEGIHEVDVMGTTYIHFMFDHHEVVLSNGSWTESFQPGDYTLQGIGNAQRNEIFELFPELKTQTGVDDYQSARRALKKHEAKLLIK